MSFTSKAQITPPFSVATSHFFWSPPPGNSEQDRTLILYLPNKFCDAAELKEEPKSPRRFPKADLDEKLRNPKVGWGLLLILLHVRRSDADLDRVVNDGARTSAFWKQRWFPKTGTLFQESRTYRNQFGTMEMEEAITQYRAWCAAAPLSTYEFQTLPKKDIRSILLRTFGGSSFDGNGEIIEGWSLRPWDDRHVPKACSRVGMVKERMTCSTIVSSGRKADGTFRGKGHAVRATNFGRLPRTHRKLVAFWQRKGVLPRTLDGRTLKIHTTEKYGDKVNGKLALCAKGYPDKNRRARYKTIRPVLLRHAKLSLVEVNEILYDLVWDLSNAQIAARRGWLKFTPTERTFRHQAISHLRRAMHAIMAYSEQKRFESILFGGEGVEVETDAGKLGGNRKSGVGRYSRNKAYVQFLGERGGEVYLHVFAHPEGGVERLSHVKAVLDGKLGTGTILHTDRARAYSAYVVDNPHLKLSHCRVNHSAADKEGFSWNLYVDEKDGETFRGFPGDYAVISVSTQTADGAFGKLKSWLHRKGGVARRDIWRFVKEYQWRTNWSRKRDLYERFLECFAETEEDLRTGYVSVTELHASLEWDYSSYRAQPEVDEYDPADIPSQQGETWTCPGCGKVIGGKHRAQYKFYRKKTCRYYVELGSRTYDHESSRCLCCVYPKKGRKRRFSEFLAGE